MRSDPNQGPVYFNIGLALLHLGRDAEARKRYEDGIQSEVADLKYYAIDDLDEAFQKNPDLKGAKEILQMLKQKYAETSKDIQSTVEQVRSNTTL